MFPTPKLTCAKKKTISLATKQLEKIAQGDYVWTGLRSDEKTSSMMVCMKMYESARTKAQWNSADDARISWNQYGCQVNVRSMCVCV
jgi:hypothetical protein